MSLKTSDDTPPSPAHKPAGWRLILVWTLQVVAAVILAQTLFFKFTGAEEARYIFTTLGVEPWGRWLAGIAELVTVILLLTPRLAGFGAALALGTMVGAIGAHLGPLGIEVLDDGGTLFALGIIVSLASIGVLILRRRELLAHIAALQTRLRG